MNKLEAVNNLGRRVVLVERIDGFPAGRTGVLVSLQSGHEPGAGGVPYATVNFDLVDWSSEENVPLKSLRPMASRM
jgi:hypothetical protein